MSATRSQIVVRAAFLCVCGLPPAHAQQAPPELRREVFRVDTEVVLLDVVVRDKKGRTVRDLRSTELVVFEDGVRQEVGTFHFLDSRATGEALEDAAAAPAAPPSAPPRAGESRHLNLVTFLFDQLDTDGRNIARKAALSFLELENRPDVYVSVFQIGESLELLQQFTDDREIVRDAVLRATGELNTQYTAATEKLVEATAAANEARDRLQTVNQASGSQTGAQGAAQVGQEVALADMVVNTLRLTDSLQREQQGRSALFAILALARHQQPLAGRKTILFFSEGVQSPPNLEHVLLSAISEANRANVSVYGVDARGLSTISGLAAARETLEQASATSMRQQMSGAFRFVTREEALIADNAEASLRMDTVGTLRQLAESTGGILITNTNDVRRGVARAVGDLRGYYEVAYSPTNREFDGRFRRVSLKVTRPGVSVQTRSGYFAMPPGEGTATFPYEVDLLRALRSSPAPHEFPLRARAFRFGYEAAGLRYTLVLELPMASLSFARDDDARFERAHFSLLGQLRGSWGAVVEKFSQDVPVSVSRRQAEALRFGNAVFLRSFALPVGRYRLETAAIDQATKRKTVEVETLEVPEERPPLALSSLAFIRRTEPVPKGALASDDPFRVGDSRVVPWVTEPEVQPSETLSLYFVAYTPPDVTGPVDLLLEFIRTGHGTRVPHPAEAGREWTHSLHRPDPGCAFHAGSLRDPRRAQGRGTQHRGAGLVPGGGWPGYRGAAAMNPGPLTESSEARA
jgi:VWFA-related protein